MVLVESRVKNWLGCWVQDRNVAVCNGARLEGK